MENHLVYFFFICVFLLHTERVRTPFSNDFLLLTHMCACVCILVCVCVDLYIQTYGGATIHLRAIICLSNLASVRVYMYTHLCVCACVRVCVCVSTAKSYLKKK